MDESQVIEEVTNGNKQAFEKLVRHYQRPLLLYLGRMGMYRKKPKIWYRKLYGLIAIALVPTLLRGNPYGDRFKVGVLFHTGAWERKNI